MLSNPGSRHPWWQEAVFYQIYPRSFQDTNGDGWGDLPGLIGRLDYLRDLGVDALWLTPIFPSPDRDGGYDVSDYRQIDPRYGTLQDLQELLAAAHQRGLKIILDLVVNHTSNRHPWFQSSRRGGAKKDWYIWARKPPNNWTSFFGGSAWSYDSRRQAYYLHSFLPEQPDLNWRNPQVQQAVLDIMEFWFRLGVDGFRLDVFNLYFKDAALRSNPRRWSWQAPFYPHAGQEHVYDRNQPELMPMLTRMRALTDRYSGVLVGETAEEKGCYWARHYYGTRPGEGLHLTFAFDFLNAPWRAEMFYELIKLREESFPAWAWPTYVWSNHDVRRFISRFPWLSRHAALARARVAAALLLTLRGTPFIYYGEELGLPEAYVPYSRLKDPPGRRFWPFYLGRDGCRTPMQWSAAHQAGFTTGRPWLPVQANYRVLNVERARRVRHSLLNFYRSLLHLRKKHAALRHGRLVNLTLLGKHGLSYARETGTERLEIWLNFHQRKVALPPAVQRRGKCLLSTAAVPSARFLNPYEASIYLIPSAGKELI